MRRKRRSILIAPTPLSTQRGPPEGQPIAFIIQYSESVVYHPLKQVSVSSLVIDGERHSFPNGRCLRH
jgi:hypothetical protein